MHVQSVQVYETEFGAIEIPEDRMPAEKRVGIINAELTRDAFLWGGFEAAILHRFEKVCE